MTDSEKCRVLVFPCGAENAAEIYRALRYSVHVELIGASSVEDHGRFRFEQYVGNIPFVHDGEFDEAFRLLVQRERIDVVFASHDSVQERLAHHAHANGYFLVNGDPRTAATLRRKSAMYRLFAGRPWGPRIDASISAVVQWPIVAKPDQGQGGQGVAIVRSADHAAQILEGIDEPVLMEWLPGEEVTVDCFTDRHRRLLWIGPRTRERVRAGISMRSTHLPVAPEVEVIAKEINDELILRGPWFFQLKRDSRGAWKLLEVCARVGGTMVAQRARGVNLPLMAIHDYLNRDLSVLPLRGVSLVERSISTVARLDAEYQTVFIDLDDTLIMNGKANPLAVAFIYQSIGDGKRIALITRHIGDVAETLNSARLSPSMFDEIIQLRSNEAKSAHVSRDAIFIDNHYPERADVARARGIPVFDVDGLEFLLR